MALNYKEYGKGIPLVILHGLLGMLDNWHSFSKKLAEDYWIITVDQRNHGKSFHDSSFNYDLLVEDLHSFLESNGIHRCYLMGHSMGGKTVLNFIHNHPDMVEKAIVVDIAPKKYDGSHHEIFKALQAVDLEEVGSRKEVENFLMDRLHSLSVVQFLMKNLSRTPEGNYRWKANIEALYDNYDFITDAIEIEEECDAEVLFIRGDRSDYISDDDIDLIRDDYPNAQFVTINNAGHWVHVDNTEELLQSVKEYLH